METLKDGPLAYLPLDVQTPSRRMSLRMMGEKRELVFVGELGWVRRLELRNEKRGQIQAQLSSKDKRETSSLRR